MDDELEWLRNAKPPTGELGDLASRRARARILDGAIHGSTPLSDEVADDDAPVVISVLPGADDGGDDREDGVEPGRRRRNRLALLGAAAALLVIVGAATLLGDTDTSSDDESAGEEPAPESDADATRTTVAPTTTTEPPVSTTTEATRTVQATPVSDLLDADIVTVAAQGFAPRERVDVAVCVTDGAEVQGCDVAPLAVVGAAQDGSVAADVSVPRTILVDGDAVDCAVASCALTLATAEKPEEAEVTPLEFDVTAEPPPSAAIAMDASTTLVDGQLLEISGAGFADNAWVTVSQCIVDRERSTPDFCEPVASTTTIADADGVFVAEIRLSRLLPVDDGWADCAGLDQGRCVVIADTLVLPTAPRSGASRRRSTSSTTPRCRWRSPGSSSSPRSPIWSTGPS